MLSYTEIKPGKLIDLDGDVFEIVATSGVVKKQRQKPHNTAKMKNLKTGATVERTFTQADKIEEAELEKRIIKYIFNKKDEYWFTNPADPSDRFFIPKDLLGDKISYIKPNDVVDALTFNGEILTIKLPIKVVLEVKEAPPNIKGNTAQGGTKLCIMETGLKVTTPLFIESGDKIVVNTETGEYIERAK